MHHGVLGVSFQRDGNDVPKALLPVASASASVTLDKELTCETVCFGVGDPVWLYSMKTVNLNGKCRVRS